MKNIFYKAGGVLFLLLILSAGLGFGFIRQAEAMVPPYLYVNVFVNSVGGETNLNYDLSSVSGGHQQLKIQTKNSLGSSTVSIPASGGDIAYLIQATSSDWQLSNVTCTSTDPGVVSAPYANGVKISSYFYSSANCTFTNIKIIKKNPVIIVPGIMSTEIFKNYGDKSEMWPAVSGLLASFSDDYLNDLSLKIDGTENSDFPMVLGDIMRKVTLSGKTFLNTWEGMISTLTAGGYIEGTDLFVFPYDWRKSDADDAVLLKAKIDEVLAQTGAGKVDLIAHSMGGLVAQKYVADNGVDKVDKLFFIGTPHLGAPSAFKTLMYGDDMGIKKFGVSLLNPSEVKDITQNFPSVFDLLPSQKYVSNGKYVLDTTANPMKWLDYNETVNYMVANGRNDMMFSQAKDLHASTDNFNLAGIDVYNFSGCGLTKTVGSITVKKENSWTSLWQKVVDDYSLSYTNGDNTVPLVSAVGPFGNRNYFVKSAVHSELPSISGVSNTVLSLLLGTSTLVDQDISNNIDFCDITGKVVSTHSPVTMNIYDSFGNHTGPTNDGDIEYGIPGVTYDQIEGNNFVFLPTGGDYKIVIKATDTGAYNFYIEEIGNNNVKTSEAYWNEIPLTTLNTNSEIDLSSASTDYVLKTDEDGDGTFELNSPPSSILNSDTVGDLTPPQTTNSVSEDSIVTLSATDDRAGVLKTEYSFGTSTWNLYTEPFSGSGKTVSYFSTDKAGNIEIIQTVDVPEFIPDISTSSEDDISTTTATSTETETITSVVASRNSGGRSGGREAVIISTSTDDQNLAEIIPAEEALVPETILPVSASALLAVKPDINKISVPVAAVSILVVPKVEVSSSSIPLTATVISAESKLKPFAVGISILGLIGVLVFINKKYIMKI